MQGCDTPATRRQPAPNAAKPPPPPAWSASEGPEGQAGAPVSVGSPATAHTEGATAKQMSPNKNNAAPLRYKTLPARAARPYFRYKTLPAHPKLLNLALFLHAGRVLYRSHHQEAEQGEFCTEREAEIGLANTTGHQAPLAWRASEGLAAVPVGSGRAWPDNESTRQAKLAARTARRRAAAHGAARSHNAAARPQPGYPTKSFPSAPCARGGASRPGRNGCGPRCAAPRLRCR